MLFRLYLGLMLGTMTILVSAGAPFTERLATLQGELATNTTNLTVLYQVGQLCYDEGAKGDHKAVELADKYFRRILELDAKQALARALLGSTITMKARDTLWPPTRMAYARAGIKEMDAAVELAPDNPDVRFVRALNNFHMPKFMDREAIVRVDFTWLWVKVRAKPEAFQEDFQQNIALFQGRILRKEKRKEEAIQAWNWGLAVNPQSPIARQIREQLTRAGVHEK